MSKKSTAKKPEQLSFLEENKSAKITTPATPVAEKPLNSDQAKQFLYMLNRMEAWRTRRISEAKKEAIAKIEATKREYSLADVLKDIKSGKIVPLVVSNRDAHLSSVNVSTSSVAGRETEKNRSVSLDSITFYVDDLYIKSEVREKVKQIQEDYDKTIKELNDSVAFYRVRLRTGNMSNLEANAIIEELTEAWSVPMSVVAEADHTNQTCTK